MNENLSVGQSIGIVNGYHAVRSTTYNKDNQVISTSATEIDYDAGFADITLTNIYPASGKTSTTSHRIYVDQYGRKKRWETQTNGHTEYINYEYNQNELLSRSHAVMGGSVEQFVDHAYDAADRLLFINSKATFGGKDPRITNVEFSYNSSGNSNYSSVAHEILYNDADEKQTEIITHRTYVVDDKGQILERLTTYDDARKSPGSSVYEYDNNGNVVAYSDISAGAVKSKTVYEYEKSRQDIFNDWLHIFRFSY